MLNICFKIFHSEAQTKAVTRLLLLLMMECGCRCCRCCRCCCRSLLLLPLLLLPPLLLLLLPESTPGETSLDPLLFEPCICSIPHHHYPIVFQHPFCSKIVVYFTPALDFLLNRRFLKT
jgi:hypothetical protein